MFKQANENYNMTQWFCQLESSKEENMEPWEIRANNKAIVLCGVAVPTSFSFLRVITEALNGLNN